MLTKAQFVKAAVYLTTFLTLAPLTIFISFLSLLSISANTTSHNFSLQKNLLDAPRFGAQVYAALPNQQAIVSGGAIAEDARAEIVRQYLEKYNSPLEPYSQLLVAASDEYGLDWRLLVAIAQQESNLCKKVPDGTFNCWGWGVHSRGTLGFSDYPTAIETVAKGIKEDYLDKGYDTVDEMMTKYTPLSSGSWAFGVNQFMSEME